MRKFHQSVVMLAIAFALSAPFGSMAQAQATPAPVPIVGPPAPARQDVQMPSPEALTVLVQAALGTLNDANVTSDYSVLLKKSSTGFRQANSEGRLVLGFAQFQEQGIDLSPSVIYPITWSQAPSLDGQNLRLVGAIESQPQAILFDLGFVFEEEKWKLAAISIGLSAPVQ